MLDFLNALFQSLSPLWEMSITAAYAAAVVIVLRLLLKKRAPRQVLCLLWLVVFARLLIPLSLESPLSIVPDTLPVQELQGHFSEYTSGAPEGGSPTTQTNQTPAQDQAPVQSVNGAVTPVINTPTAPSLSIPEGITPSTPEQPAASFPWRAILAGVWLTGAAAMGLYALASYFRLRRRLFDAVRARDGAWEHPAVESPFILGMLRPRIYLPVGLVGRPRKFILCHERAHLRRLDHIVKPVCWVALALHWFNPLVWTAFILMSRDIEAACDEAVVRQLGIEIKADYSTTLLALATGRHAPSPCPLAFDEGDARSRIQNVLGYRRPALWVIVVSAVMAVMAAVCLLTDPVAAKEPEEDDPGASVSQAPEESAPPAPSMNSLLDPWMKEVLDGERQFISAFSQYAEGDGRTYGIHDLRTFYYGDDQYPDERVELGKLAIIDLDRDGVNEMVIWPVGDYEYLYSNLGYLILRRQGDEVYGYNPVYRAFGDLKSDGTFSWSNGAAWGGYATLTFGPGQVVLHETTYHKPGESEIDQLYFVDGQKATQKEFWAANDAQFAKPDVTWYVYEDGRLNINVPIPLDDEALSVPVPDFLDADQQLLYRQMYAMYTRIFGCNSEECDNWPTKSGLIGGKEPVEYNGAQYWPAEGLYARWSDFEEAVLSVFTERLWTEKNAASTTYVNIDGTMHYLAWARGGGGYNENFPETFQLVERTDDTISFIMTGYYSEQHILDGETSEQRDARIAAGWETYIEFPMRMVKTANGWRFDEFHCARTDNGVYPFYNQQVPNPNNQTAALAPNFIPTLDYTLTDGQHIPEDPEQWYLVSELPDDMIWLFTRNYGEETLIQWDGNFQSVFAQRAHTPRGIMPIMKKLGGSDTYGPLAVISNVGSGTGVSLYRLVVYDLDAYPVPVEYTHDWGPLCDDFNQNRSSHYDKDTHVLTCAYQGQTAELQIDGGEEMFRRIDAEGIRLAASGLVVTYWFNEDGSVQIEFPLQAYIGSDVISAPLVWPWFLRWTIRFNGNGFDTVPGSCQLVSSLSYQ